MDELHHAYEVLGVPPDIRTGDLRRHYRELVKRWHPDQFTGDQEEHGVADEALTRINAAYQCILRHRARLGNPDDSDAPPPPVEEDPVASSEPESDASNGSEDGATGNRGRNLWPLGLAVLLVLSGIMVWRQFRPPPEAPVASEAARLPSVASNTAAPVPPGRPIAFLLRITADDFVVAIWHNGERVPDNRRKLLGDVYGATMEQVDIDVHEGDWLVFNVASNPVRWGGSSFFGVAGMLTPQATTFSSSLKDGRWTFEESLDRLPAFLSSRNVQGQPVLPPAPEWDQGRTRMQEITSRTWNGDPVWGLSHNTWIKFIASPITNRAPAPPR